MSKISTYKYKPVVFGAPGFKGPMKITSTGGIVPSQGTATALYIPDGVASPILFNAGDITGGIGYGTDADSYNGGIGIKVAAAAKITNTGLIYGGYGGTGTGAGPVGNGGVGVYISTGGTTLKNSGSISGGIGGNDAESSGAGGVGVAVYAASSVVNTGTINGGNGGNGAYDTVAGRGGKGVVLAGGAQLTNSGTIYGGGGGEADHVANGAAGGVGVYLQSGSALNNGLIIGGDGGKAGIGGGSGYGGDGGDGVEVKQGKFTNNGTIVGAAGGFGYGTSSGSGGTGIVVYGTTASGSNGKNGIILGGAGGNDFIHTTLNGQTYTLYSKAPGDGLPGLGVLQGASFNNAGKIIGGASGLGSAYNSYAAAPSGWGAVVVIGTLVNSGVISGAAAGEFIYGAYGILGYEKAAITNTGKVYGGAAGYGGQIGGDGVELRNASTLNTSGQITGGAGGYKYNIGGTGGSGLAIYDSSASNSGIIRGGAGGKAFQTGGSGGIGVQIGNGVFVNNGSVIGGARGVGQHSKGAGGIGVVLTTSGTETNHGVTLVNAGTITGTGGQDAVLVGNVNGTVVAESGAVFKGNVVATNGSFELAGTGATAMAGFGTKIKGFTSIDFATNAKWVISGDIVGLASGETINGFAPGDGIKITNAAEAGGTVVVEKAGVVTVEVDGGTTITLDIANAKAGATNYKFANDKLTETNASAKMTFLAPKAETPPSVLSAWAPILTPPTHFYGFAAGSAAVQTHMTIALAGGMHEVNLTPSRGFEPMVTLQAG